MNGGQTSYAEDVRECRSPCQQIGSSQFFNVPSAREAVQTCGHSVQDTEQTPSDTYWA